MKKLLLVSISLFLLCTTSFAQEGLRFGLMDMPQNVWLLNSDDDTIVGQEKKLTFGNAFGAMLGFGISSKFGVEVDFILSKQGQAYEQSGTVGIPDYNINLNYFKIPLLLRFNTDPENRAMFVFAVGPQLGFRTKANWELASNGFTTDVKAFYKKSYTSAVLDLGTDIRLVSSLYFNLRMRADYSLSELEDKSAWFNASRAKTSSFNAGVLLGLTYAFAK